MTNKQHGAPGTRQVLHFFDAAPLKFSITDREHLVNKQNVLVEISGNGKSQPNIHSTGVMLYRCVDELLNSGKADDIVELVIDLGAGHAQDCAVEIDVFSARELAVKARPDLK